MSSKIPSGVSELHRSARQKDPMTWQTVDDIDWTEIDAVLTNLLYRVFSAPPNVQPRFELLFWIDLNGGFNCDVHQRLPADQMVRFRDILPYWRQEIDSLDRAFQPLIEKLEEDGVETGDSLEVRLRDVIRNAANMWSERNFGYPPSSEVRWRIQNETPRPKDFP